MQSAWCLLGRRAEQLGRLLVLLPLHALYATPLHIERLHADFVQVERSTLVLEGSVQVEADVWQLQGPSLRLQGACPHSVTSMTMPSGLLEWEEQAHLWRVQCPGPVRVCGVEHRAYLVGVPGQRLLCSNGEMILEAERCEVELDATGWHPRRLRLEGDVRYRALRAGEHEMPALVQADKAHVELDPLVVVLAADLPQRVRLWNRGATQQLHCGELTVRRDPTTGQLSYESGQVVTFCIDADVVRVVTGLRTSLDVEELEEEGSVGPLMDSVGEEEAP